jgi:tetratricopeptide (TPR) repeat protein
MRLHVRLLALSALALGAALATACASNSFGFRDQRCDPDERLDDLMDAWSDARKGDCDQNKGHVIIDCERVRNDLERLAFEFPAHVPTLMANAAVAYESRDRVKAGRYLDSLLDVQQVHAEAAMLRSRIAIEEGNLPAARRLLEEQVRCAPDHAGLREAHAAALYMSGQYVDANAALAVAERLGAPGWRIAFHRGLVAEAAGDAREAERHYQDALRLDPECAAARSRLAGLRAVHDASAGDIDRLHERGPDGSPPPGLAILSGQ